MKKIFPPITILALLALLVPGCTYESPAQDSWDGGVDCNNNTNPRLGKWRMNSSPRVLSNGSLSESEWLLASNFFWRDPYPTATNEDPPNMIGGWISMEIENAETTSIPYIDEGWLQTGCPEGQSSECAALGFPNGGYTTDCNGSPNCDCSGNRCGSLTVLVSSEDGIIVEGAAFHVVFRIRDRCGAASNEYNTYTRGRYVVGSGLVDVTAETKAILDGLNPN